MNLKGSVFHGRKAVTFIIVVVYIGVGSCRGFIKDFHDDFMFTTTFQAGQSTMILWS